jgi:8-oxo-dGTP pyrophosphatase MutT (NUDIX family)
MVARILSAGVVLLHWYEDHYKYLLLRAYNYWDFPKGMVEPGESPLEGAIREVREETAITKLNFRWGTQYRQTYPYNHGRKIARYYIAETPITRVHLPINPLLGRPEHNEHRWVTRAEAWTLLTPRVQAILAWADDVIGQDRCGSDKNL